MVTITGSPVSTCRNSMAWIRFYGPINMDILRTILEWIKKVFNDPKLLLTLVITSLFLLLSPPAWLKSLGVDLVVAEYRGIIALVCLFAGASFFATVSSTIINSFAERQVEKSAQNEDIENPMNLNDDD